MTVDNQFQALTVRRSQDAVVGVTDTPDDVTGFALRFCVRRRPGTDQAALLTKTTGGGVTITGAHSFDVTLTAANVNTLPAGRYSWDCWRTDSGSESQLCAGDFYVLERGLVSLLGRLRLFVGLTTTAEDDLLQQLLGGVHQAVVDWVGWDPTPRDGVVEYYDTVGTQEFPLRTPVVRAVNEVRVDETGYYGQAPGSFGPTTVLTGGVDYALRLDGPGAAYSKSGLLVKLRGHWPLSWLRVRGLLTQQKVPCRGCVMVDYDAGYDVLPESIELACLLVASRVRRMRQYGVFLESESYEGYSYHLGKLAQQFLVGDVETMLAPYREIRVC